MSDWEDPKPELGVLVVPEALAASFPPRLEDGTPVLVDLEETYG